MGILTISRDWGVSPSIVRVTTTDSLATITTAQYITSQEANINAVNFGDFEWATGDLVAIVYSGGEDYFTRDAVNNTFILNTIPAGAIPLTSAHILVGNAANHAADVAMSGVIAITNTGATSYVNGSIVDAAINATAAIAFSKLAALPSGNILVGSAGNAATSVAMSGDVAIIASGATTIQNDAITTVKILNANVTLAKLAAGITPSHVIKFGGQLTTVGGASNEAFTITGVVAATDFAFLQMVDMGTNSVSILEALLTNDTLTVNFTGDPSNDTIFNYQIIRAVS